MAKLQKAQNKLVRVLENVYLKDKINTSTLLSNQNMLWVNQMAAQIKLTEIWKAKNVENFPIKVHIQTTAENAKVTRGDTSERLIESGRTELARNACICDATRLWNHAPNTVRTAKSLYTVKKEIRSYALTLPL